MMKRLLLGAALAVSLMPQIANAQCGNSFGAGTTCGRPAGAGTGVPSPQTVTNIFGTQVANRVFAGPATGVDTNPTFRALVTADFPISGVTAAAYGSSTAIPTFTVDATGRLTIASTAVVIAPAGTLTGTTLAANVVSTSITGVGTLTSGATGAGFTVALSTSTITGTLAAARLPAFTGDISTSAGSSATTLATVNSNTGSFGGASSVPNFTVNGKGLITAAGATTVIAPAGTLTGTTLNATVVTSSLTSVGTLTSGSLGVGFTTVAVARGGTNCTTASGTCLDNITGFASTGVMSRTASGTYAFRTITGGTGITMTNGDGVSGNQIVALTSATMTVNGTSCTLGSSCTTGGASGTPTAPQGRLTLISGNPNPKSSQAGASTLYYTPASGNYIPLTADGSTFTMTLFTERSQLTIDTTKSPAAAIANAIYDVFCWIDTGPSVTCSRGDYWKSASRTMTVTAATPAVVTCASCNFNVNFQPPVVFTGLTAITGLSNATTYWLKPTSATTANVSLTAGGANINTTGSTSGTSIIYGDDTGADYRSGTTSLTKSVAGYYLNTSSISNGPAASRGIYVGSVRTDASALLNMTLGSSTAGGGPALLHVFNQDNQMPAKATVGDSTAAWTYSSSTWRMMNNSAGNRVSYLMGMPSSPIYTVRGSHNVSAAALSAYGFVALTKNIITSANVNNAFGQFQTPAAVANNYYFSPLAILDNELGANFLQEMELSDGTNSSTFEGSAGAMQLEVTTLQ